MIKFNKITLFWIVTIIILCASAFLLKSILLPFILSFVLAYVLNPLVVKLQKHHFNRTWATGVVITGLLLIVLLSVLILIPVLQAQIISFAVKVPALANALWIKVQPLFDMIKEHISETQLSYLKETISSQTAGLMDDMSATLMRLCTGWSALFNIISFVVITPVVTFYLLNDWNVIVEKIKIPRRVILMGIIIIRRLDARYLQGKKQP